MKMIIPCWVFFIAGHFLPTSGIPCPKPSWFFPYGTSEGDSEYLLYDPHGSNSEVDLDTTGSVLNRPCPDHNFRILGEFIPSGFGEYDCGSGYGSGIGSGVTRFSGDRMQIDYYEADELRFVHGDLHPRLSLWNGNPYESSGQAMMDGAVSGIFVRGTTDSDILDRATYIINKAYHFDDYFLPLFEADWAAIWTHHCVVDGSQTSDGYRAMLGRTTTIQTVIVTGQNVTYIIFNVDRIADAMYLDDNIGVFSFESYQYRLTDDKNDYSRPDFYTTMTNALRPGQWVLYIGHGTAVPAPIVNPWYYMTPCRCGGCVQRFRVIDGKKEYKVFPCHLQQPCFWTVHDETETIYSPKEGRWIVRERHCCYDFRYSPPPMLAEPVVCTRVSGWSPI